MPDQPALPLTPPVECGHCCGNGEVVTDWDRYLVPLSGDTGDEAVADCPDCDGTGWVGGEP
jgi:hypothetical protein